jgi:uncharacterized protein YciI
MPLFAFIGTDGPRGAELRKVHRPAHLERLEKLAAAHRIHHAGPLLDPDGNPTGSLIVFEADSEASARAVAEGDPYVNEGVFGSWQLQETKQVFP